MSGAPQGLCSPHREVCTETPQTGALSTNLQDLSLYNRAHQVELTPRAPTELGGHKQLSAEDKGAGGDIPLPPRLAASREIAA